MPRSLCLSVLLALLGTGFSLFFAAGGCGGTRPPAVQAAPAPLPTPEIGRTPGIVAKLEQPARVTATLYPADGSESSGQSVTVAPGTWLVPEAAFTTPEGR